MSGVSDPRYLLRRIASKAHTIWLRRGYPFALLGDRVSVHPSCDIGRAAARFISLDDRVFLAAGVWLNVEDGPANPGPKIVLGNGCKIGRRSTISAKNRIELEPDVLLAPSVLVMDHNHEYCDVERPIHVQGTTQGGRILIERNCWLGYNSVVCCGKGELVLGRNSIVGANSVVNKSFPPFSVVAGNPARLIRRYNPASSTWERVAADDETSRVEPVKTYENR